MPSRSHPRYETCDVTINGRTDALLGRPSMLCHYWGRQLLRRWLWLSANDLDRPELAVEAGVLRSQAWGRRVPLPTLGYAWLEDRSATHMVASPIDGLVRYAPRATGGVNISVAGLRGRWQLQAWAPGPSFVDLGEGIAQSLRAGCRLLVPSGEALAQGVPPWRFEMRNGLPAACQKWTQPTHSPPTVLAETPAGETLRQYQIGNAS